MAETEKVDISYMGPIFKKCHVDAKRTQEEVAEKVGITARFLIALENEERRPSIDNLLRLVDTLNIPGDSILHPQIQHIDSEGQQLLRQYMRLNDHDKAVIPAAIQEMLNNR
ncbi:XRE family transcriptional regulator [Mediterraneibacter gnavus]|uniref:XRE family transcriptional regulator n=1 Tax=Mediterraneibacter gnavus TaxID=33038 RepID=A0A415SB76_MEDGN|nr:helix-turn-helix transcriptional regulator [Mediterraneibacter gnavus]RHM77686.1 XRE family transcriptional regulator [Mediterraneibacter gnavus]